MAGDTTCTLLDEATRFVSDNKGQDSARLVARMLEQGARMNAEIASLRARAARAEAALDARTNQGDFT